MFYSRTVPEAAEEAVRLHPSIRRFQTKPTKDEQRKTSPVKPTSSARANHPLDPTGTLVSFGSTVHCLSTVCLSLQLDGLRGRRSPVEEKKQRIRLVAPTAFPSFSPLRLSSHCLLACLRLSLECPHRPVLPTARSPPLAVSAYVRASVAVATPRC